jgi:acyl carrier protein
MDKTKIFKQVEAIFKDVLDDESIALTEATAAADIEAWDSLAHVQLVVAIEKRFKIKFDSREILSWKNVGEILEAIGAKVG